MRSHSTSNHPKLLAEQLHTDLCNYFVYRKSNEKLNGILFRWLCCVCAIRSPAWSCVRQEFPNKMHFLGRKSNRKMWTNKNIARASLSFLWFHWELNYVINLKKNIIRKEFMTSFSTESNIEYESQFFICAEKYWNFLFPSHWRNWNWNSKLIALSRDSFDILCYECFLNKNKKRQKTICSIFGWTKGKLDRKYIDTTFLIINECSTCFTSNWRMQ